MVSKSDLRRGLRRQRRALTPRDQARHEQLIARHLAHSLDLRRTRSIAAYLAADGEPGLGVFIRRILQAGGQVYLPVLSPLARHGLWFRRYDPDTTRLLRNRYGIPEPSRRSPRLPAQRLDVVLAPLVAFDARGRRLGMGGGYYDRSLSFVHRRRRWQKPRIIGVAHSFQEVDELPAEPWDVPLWGVVTERGLTRFPRDAKESNNP